MSSLQLSGTYTAIVTPFAENGSLDMDGFRRLIEWQIEAGVDGIVPVGTTGESPTLNVAEHEQVITCTVETVAGRAKVIAGTGANSTSEAVELTRFAKECGADATLQVTPYYNKPNQEGLYRHFTTIADIGLPVVLYNVPGRSAVAIDVDTVARCAAHESIIAVKEAGGLVERVPQILGACEIQVLSGDDGLTLPMMREGAIGLISVASNVIPAEMTALTHAALEGRWDDAQAIHDKYITLFDGVFIDTNPIPIKAAMSLCGHMDEIYRLPLCEMSSDKKVEFEKILRSTGVLS